ncbi:TatD family hydrolase [Patescibacteria group bacterium]|nr:TatD family hydrolase [Patescibacteria group bacterium]
MDRNDQMPIIDAHSHVQFPAYDADRDVVLARAREANVKMIAVGTQYATSKAAVDFAHAHPDEVWAAVGFHPNHLAEQWHHDLKEQSSAAPEQFDREAFLRLAADPKVVAIGECGLDYYRMEGEDVVAVKKAQREVFKEQIAIAEAVGKPLMVHCRPSKGTDDAYEDLISIIHDSKFTIPCIIHFYVGGPEITKRLVAASCSFTFGGVITFARNYDASIALIPLDRILLETDCPYVAPQSQRGKRNEPAFIRETAEALAKIKDISAEEFLRQAHKNTREIFKI